MAIPLAAAVVAVISLVGVGIFKVVEGDHEPSSLIFSSRSDQKHLLAGCRFGTRLQLAPGLEPPQDLVTRRIG
jgi:hypothetical protein